ncbi:DUF3791 domain-containing protein [Terrisporobacter mayombei]|uniref:DUF3791 domain-containing protein n=1 Tax=Terrisporobacter mayombei TaxID=1541 RepID=UPI002FE6D314
MAEYLGKGTKEVYKLIKNDSNILEDYIIPCYEPLHSQSKKIHSRRTCRCTKRKRCNIVELYHGSYCEIKKKIQIFLIQEIY